MNILIVAATEKEISLFRTKINSLNKNIELLITGPGMVSTVFHLTEKLSKKKYDLVINAGLAGSFTKNIELGNVVNVTQESFSELGAEDENNFVPISEMSFDGPDDFPLRLKTLVNNSNFRSDALNSLVKVKDITVNTVHGNEESIQKVKRHFSADVETMEGGAVFYVCTKKNISYLQVRAISNYVEKRDKSKWEIEKAVKNLCDTLEKLIEELLIDY